MAVPRLPGPAWILLPVAVHLLIMQHLWFNAPVWDEYPVLGSVLRMHDAASLREWLGLLVAQHNEHRIAFARFVEWAWTTVTGSLDFRALSLLGNLALAGLLGLAWVEFRNQVAPLGFAAATWVLLNWSYFDAALIPMATFSNLGVILASFACLHFALRGGWASGAASIGTGVVAAFTQGNGLLALPLAAVACARTGRPGRAAAMVLVSTAIWITYFQGYVRPGNLPSPMMALDRPVETVHLFLIVIGGLQPGHWPPTLIGAAILFALGWLLWRGLWRTHPAVALWIAFILLSAAAAAVFRVGFGVYHASRYAINASILLVIVVLGAWALARPVGWRARVAVALAAFASALATAANWSLATEQAYRARMLAKAIPTSPGMGYDKYYGVNFSDPAYVTALLADTERRGLYSPPPVAVHPFAVRVLAHPPAASRVFGAFDQAWLEGNRIHVLGWTDVSAREAGTVVAVYSPQAMPISATAASCARTDVAYAYRSERLLYSGFRLEVVFATADDAARALPSLCIFAQSAGQAIVAPPRPGVHCSAPIASSAMALPA